ncbi:hypothetical protein QP296_28210, partial [Escherichia coli]|nr:hypothetical protein [Escherichia coli]
RALGGGGGVHGRGQRHGHAGGLPAGGCDPAVAARGQDWPGVVGWVRCGIRVVDYPAAHPGPLRAAVYRLH